MPRAGAPEEGGQKPGRGVEHPTSETSQDPDGQGPKESREDAAEEVGGLRPPIGGGRIVDGEDVSTGPSMKEIAPISGCFAVYLS